MADDIEVPDGTDEAETETEEVPEETTDENVENPEEGTDDTEDSDEDEPADESDDDELEVEAEEEPEEPKEKLPSKYHRPVFSEIKKEFPEFFKKFPEMREIYFREGQYSKIFPTAEEAEEAFNKANNFDTLAEDLAKGSTEKLLASLKQGGNALLSSVAESFLPTLYKTDPKLYEQVASPIVEYFIINLHKEGDRIGGENGEYMKAAAQYAAKFFNDDPDVSKLGKNQKAIDPNVEAEKKRLAEEQNRLHSEAYKAAYTQVAEKAQKLLLTEISKSVALTDPYKRDKAIQDIFEKMNDVLTSDERHIKLMNSLWNKSRKDSFSTESKRTLVSTLLARAKQILPAINREIMAQINPKKVVKKKNAAAGGKVDQSSSPSGNGSPTGKVDWSKYPGGRADFINHFVESKGNVHRVK